MYWIEKYFPAKIDVDFDSTDPLTIETPVLGRIFGTIEFFHRQIVGFPISQNLLKIRDFNAQISRAKKQSAAALFGVGWI